MKNVLLDLFCGSGGWSIPALEKGWLCYGIDIVNHGYPGRFTKMSLPQNPTFLMQCRPTLVVASPPCEQFARKHLPWINSQAALDMTLLHWALTLPKIFECPVIIECSLFAKREINEPCIIAGSYALWGNVPTLMPKPPRRKESKSGKRPERRAMIEPVLAEWIISQHTT
jgi:hypothetical protein